MMLKIVMFVLSIVLLRTSAQKGKRCTLPDSRLSECIRIHYCDTLWTMITSTRGNPSPEQVSFISEHSCGKSLVCCPDGSKDAGTTTSGTKTTERVNEIPKANSPSLPGRSDLKLVNSHKNIDLLNQNKCGILRTADKIINGVEAEIGEYPWMALLQYKSRSEDSLSFNCGGTLITPWFVLTAGHCVNRDLIAVRLGEHKISTKQDCSLENEYCADPVQDILIDKSIRHPKYDNVKKINDIALLRLISPANVEGRYVKTICLPLTQDSQIESIDQLARNKMTIAGWGKIGSGVQSDVLQKAYVPYVQNDACAKRFVGDNIPIYDTYLCAGGMNKTDTCKGDSGGPIQTFGIINGRIKAILFGVVSVGIQCLNLDVIYPGIYTNVAYYLDWILDNVS